MQWIAFETFEMTHYCFLTKHVKIVFSMGVGRQIEMDADDNCEDDDD